MSDPRLSYIMDKSYRAAVCIHEAIHADYMEQIGDDYVEFIPLPEEERYRYCDALVTNHKSESEDLAQMKADLLGYMKSILAGGIAEEVLTNSSDDCTGVDKDKEEFKAAFNTLGIAGEKRGRILAQARADILRDLRSPAFRNRLWARARFYQHILEQVIMEKKAKAA